MGNMNFLTANDLRLGLEDLFTEKLPLVEQTMAFKIYRGKLDTNRQLISSIVKSLDSKPLSAELKAADDQFDTYGRVAFTYCKIMSEINLLDAEKRDLLSTVQKELMPDRRIMGKSYADEAASAIKKRPLLAQREVELRAFTVAPDVTLYDLLNTHIEAGIQMDTLLSSRAAVTADVAAEKSQRLLSARVVTLGLLGSLREVLADEVSANPELDPALANKVFAYFDQMADSRETNKKTDPTA